MVDPLSYFSFQPVFHNWYKIGLGMCYPVCGMVHIKEHYGAIIRKSSPCTGGKRVSSLTELSFTKYPTPFNPK